MMSNRSGAERHAAIASAGRSNPTGSVPLEEVAAHIDALVARDAAERLEQLIAGQLLRRDRGGFARKPAVEPAARCDQGALVGRNHIQEDSDVGLPPVRAVELPYRFGVGAQLAHDFVRTRGHNLGITKRPLGMVFNVYFYERLRSTIIVARGISAGRRRRKRCQKVSP